MDSLAVFLTECLMSIFPFGRGQNYPIFCLVWFCFLWFERNKVMLMKSGSKISLQRRKPQLLKKQAVH